MSHPLARCVARLKVFPPMDVATLGEFVDCQSEVHPVGTVDLENIGPTTLPQIQSRNL